MEIYTIDDQIGYNNTSRFKFHSISLLVQPLSTGCILTLFQKSIDLIFGKDYPPSN